MSLKHMLHVLDHSDSQHGQRLVLLALAEHANDRDESYPAVGTLARRANVSERSVQLALRALVEAGELVDVGESPYRTRAYRLTLIRTRPEGEESSPLEASQGEISDGLRVKNLRDEGEESSPEPTTKPTTQPTTTAHAQEAMLPDPVQIVGEHWARRSGQRAPVDASQRKLIRAALTVRSPEQCCAAIDGLFSDPWWRENRPKLELRYALRGNHSKGESDGDRIDTMGAKAGQFNAGTEVDVKLAELSEGRRQRAAELMNRVRKMYRRPDSEPLVRAGRDAATLLRSQYSIIAVESADGGFERWGVAS